MLGPTDARLLHELVWTAASERPDETAILFEGYDISWAGLKEHVAHAAAFLDHHGIGRGSHVGVITRNSPLIVELVMAAGMRGAAVTIVNWRLAAPEVEHVLTDSDVSMLVVEDEFLDLVPGDSEVVRGDYGSYRELVDRFCPAEPSQVDESETAVILYSSGTTGRPKGVMLSHRALLWRARSPEFVGATELPAPRIATMVPMPMFHIGGLTATLHNLALGSRIRILREASLPVILAAIEQGDDQAFLAPTVIQMILDGDEQMKSIVGSLRELRYGSAPMPLPLLRRALATWPTVRFNQSYGATETAGMVTSLTDADHRCGREDVLTSAGRPIAGTEICIVDPETLDSVEPGETGEVWVRAPYLCTGYYAKSGATADLFTSDWLRTGDVGVVDATGFLYIKDRLKDMIISGGENIYSAEVEAVLASFPGVAAAAIVGIPDEKWGERPVAFIETEPGVSLDVEALQAYCRSNLARFKCPARYEKLETLPRNAMGKVRKDQLREVVV